MSLFLSEYETKRKKIVNTIVLFFDFVRFEHFFLFIKSSVDFVLKAICSLYGRIGDKIYLKSHLNEFTRNRYSSCSVWFFHVNTIPTGCCHVILLYGLIPPSAGRNSVKSLIHLLFVKLIIFFIFRKFHDSWKDDVDFFFILKLLD